MDEPQKFQIHLGIYSDGSMWDFESTAFSQKEAAVEEGIPREMWTLSVARVEGQGHTPIITVAQQPSYPSEGNLDHTKPPGRSKAHDRDDKVEALLQEADFTDTSLSDKPSSLKIYLPVNENGEMGVMSGGYWAEKEAMEEGGDHTEMWTLTVTSSGQKGMRPTIYLDPKPNHPDDDLDETLPPRRILQDEERDQEIEASLKENPRLAEIYVYPKRARAFGYNYQASATGQYAGGYALVQQKVVVSENAPRN